MSRETDIDVTFVTAQQRMLRIAERDHGLTPAAIEAETGISKRTVRAWSAKGASAISGPMLVRLASCMPNHLMSLVFEPSGKAVYDAESGDGDLGQLTCSLAKLLSLIADAQRDGRVDHREREAIADLARQVAADASGFAR